MKQLSINNQTSFKQLFNIFLASKKALGVKDKTLQTYKAHLNAMSYHMNTDTNIDQISNDDIKQMIVSMRDSGLAPNSIKSYTITLRAFYNWCNDEGYSHLKIKAYKGEETIKETYTDEELIRLLRRPNMKKCTFMEYRNWVIVNLLMNSGCRASTIRNIKIADVDLDQGYIYYRHTKSGKVQIAPLCSQMGDILREYMDYRKGNDNDFLFCTCYGEPLQEAGLRKAIASYNRSRGVEKTSTHLYRHTFAKKYLLDCKGNAIMLQKLLGHSTLDMTTRYCNLYNADLIFNFDDNSPLSQMQKKTQIIKMKK